MKSEYLNSYLRFADALFSGVAKKVSKSENTLLSPYSMYSLMCMLADGANLETRGEIINALAKDNADYYLTLSDLASAFDDSGEAEFHDADAVIVKADNRKHIRNDFVRLIDDLYGAPVLSSDDIVSAVNKWVRKNTNGMIKTLLQPGADPDLCLLNAIAFEAKWMRKYQPDDIEEEQIFTNSSGREESATMLSSTEHAWLEGEHLIGFAKPYKGGKYDFVALILKSEEDDISEFLPSVSLFSELYRNGRDCKTVVTMPEFTFDFSAEMTDILKKMGIISAFDPGKADLSFLTSLPGSYVESVLHKTHIENTRQGTKAAAVSAAMLVCGCIPNFDEIKYVTLDRPFAFAIMHRETAAPLFVGIVNTLEGR